MRKTACNRHSSRLLISNLVDPFLGNETANQGFHCDLVVGLVGIRPVDSQNLRLRPGFSFAAVG